MRPILYGTALCPLLRFPKGAKLRLKVIMDSGLPLAGKALVFAARSRYATGGHRPLFLATLAGSPDAWTATSPNTVELSLTPDAVDETAESTLTFGDLQADKDVLWRLDVLDDDGYPQMRLQGDQEWLQEEGAWPDEPRSTAAIPTLNVSIVSGVATVSVALISDGVSVSNESVNAAIAEDAASTREALELGTAATADTGDFDAAGAAGTAQTAAIASAASSLSTHASATNGVHGISAAAAGVVNQSTVALMRSALGLGASDSVEFGLMRVDPAATGESFSVPALKIGPHNTGIAHLSNFFMALVVNGTPVMNFDPRGGSNSIMEVGWPYIAAGIFRPVPFTVATPGDTTQYNGCIARFSDGDDGSPCLAFCTGGAWRRILIGAAVSSS